MKRNKITGLLLLATANFTLLGSFPDENPIPEVTIGIAKYQPHEYKNVCFTAYRWDEDGNTWILLGKEKRGYRARRQHRGPGPRPELRIEWLDFCGGKEPEDENSLQTAKREALEETAGQLKFREGMILTYRGRRNRYTIHYIAPVQYIDPYLIEQAAEKLRKEGLGKGIEKIEWRWVKLQDLLDGTSGLNLYWSLEQKLKHPTMRPFFESLIKEGKSSVLPKQEIILEKAALEELE